MGIHTWMGYVGYEKKAADSLKDNIERYCDVCHTPDDVGGCHKCPIGIANDCFMKYLRDAYENNADVDLLSNIIEDEPDYYKYLRLSGNFRPPKPTEATVETIKKAMLEGGTPQNMVDKWSRFAKDWARSREGWRDFCEVIKNIKKSKTRWDK